MAFNPVPTPAESSVLAQIAGNESGGNYGATNPQSTASGAYQMINATWRMAAVNVGIDVGQYPTAVSAPPGLQDLAALWLLQNYGPNASITWAASAPPGGYPSAGISPPPATFPLGTSEPRPAPESLVQTSEDSD